MAKSEDNECPKGWKRYRLADLCSPRRSIVRPTADAAVPYVGLEHIDSRQLALTRWGHSSEVRSSKTEFEAGDVLYGKLRPYLEKAVLAPCKGLCTTELIALEANPQRCIPEYLVGLVHTRLFVQHAIDTTGGTNLPRTSWSGLKEFCACVPAIHEQKSISDVLQTVQQAKETTAKVIAAARQLKASLMRHLLTYGGVPIGEADQVDLTEAEEGIYFPSHWTFTAIGSVAELQYGYRTSIPKTPPPNGIPIISTAEITNYGILNLEKLRTVEVPEQLVERYSVHRNDILFNWRNSQEHVGKTAMVEDEFLKPTVFASFIIRVVTGEKIHHRFLHYVISHLRQERVFFKQSRRAVNQANFNANELAAVKIAFPSLKEQAELANCLLAADRQIAVAQSRLNALDSVFSSILQEMMTGVRRLDEVDSPTLRKGEKRSPLADLFGKWPGDESDEQVRKALEEMD